MTAMQPMFTATDAGIPVASQEPSLTVGPSALDRLLARGRIRGALAMLGPAFVASVAYVDPGNFATNIQGGAQYGYLLLWVVLAANLMAMVVQYLSAKLGIVTGRAASSRRSSRCSGSSPLASCMRPSGSARPSPVRCMAWCPAWMAPARCTWRPGSSAPP